MGASEKTWRKVVAKILSVILVLVLMVTPVLLSALSMLSLNTITKVVTEAVGQISAKQTEDIEDSSVLSEGIQQAKSAVEDVFGEHLNQKSLDKMMDSNAAKEVIAIYTEDLTNALTGSNKQSRLSADTLKEIVDENMDEILDIAQEFDEDLTKDDLKELESDILREVDENAGEIIAAIPDPKEIKNELTKSLPGMTAALHILAMKNAFKAMLIGLIVLLSALIFVCLLPNFRGFRCLAVNLFVGGGISGLLCAVFGFGMSVLLGVMPVPVIATVAKVMLGTFTRGLVLRTAVMLMSGGLLLTAYLVINKLRAKKAPVTMEET